MRRRTSGQHRKAEEARRVVQQALGDAARRDGHKVAKFVPTTKAPEPPQPKNEAIGVLTMREAAARLGISFGC